MKLYRAKMINLKDIPPDYKLQEKYISNELVLKIGKHIFRICHGRFDKIVLRLSAFTNPQAEINDMSRRDN